MVSLTIDLTREREQLLQEESWLRGDRTAKTLVKEPHLRLVLIAMKSGAQLDPHQTEGPLTIQPLQGRLRVTVQTTPTDLAAGQILTIETGVTHAVEALEESVFLLTLGWPRATSS